MEIHNAVIESTTLGPKAYGGKYFSSMLNCEWPGSGCSFGSHLLTGAWGMAYITKILETLEVESWENLKGQLIRVRIEDQQISAIGHILKNQWFDPKKDLNHLTN